MLRRRQQPYSSLSPVAPAKMDVVGGSDGFHFGQLGSQTWKRKRVLIFLLVIFVWVGFLILFYAESVGGRELKTRPTMFIMRLRHIAASVKDTVRRVGHVFDSPIGPSAAPSPFFISIVAPAADDFQRETVVDGYPVEREEGSSGCAIVTMIAGNGAARAAVALLQSLVDVNTEVNDFVVMLQRGGLGSPECLDSMWRRTHNRGGQYAGRSFDCSGPDTIAEEIVSPVYLEILKKLGARLVVTPEIPRTPFTDGITGGSKSFWGMSLNKLQAFNMTQYEKIIFLDSDVIVNKNIDHLCETEYPTLTAAVTYSCCNRNSPATVSGGMWVFQPDEKLGLLAWQLMLEGMPQWNSDGTPLMVPTADGEYTQKRGAWLKSDLDIIAYMFANRSLDSRKWVVWPMIDDLNHGFVEGLRTLPVYRTMDDAEFKQATKANGKVVPEGFIADNWDGEAPTWHALPVQYDQCIGNCFCLPGRDLKTDYATIHFSCIEYGMHKPGWYSSEKSLMEDLMTKAPGCYRYYYLEWYYAKFLKAGGRLEAPYWDGPPVPTWNETLDVAIRLDWAEKKKAGVNVFGTTRMLP